MCPLRYRAQCGACRGRSDWGRPFAHCECPPTQDRVNRGPVRAGEVHVLFVGAADEVRELRRCMIGIDLPQNRWGLSNQDHSRWLLSPELRSPCAGDWLRGQFLCFDGVQFVIAAQYDGDDVAGGAVDQQGLQAARGIDFQEFAQVGDGAGVRRWRLGQGLSRPRHGALWASRSPRSLRLPRSRPHPRTRSHLHRSLRGHGIPGRCCRRCCRRPLHRAKFQSQAGKDACVRVEHGAIALARLGSST